MKFLALAALVATASAAACTEAELADNANCDVTAEGASEPTCTAYVEGETVCDEAATEEEEEASSSALFASAATLAVASTMMF